MNKQELELIISDTSGIYTTLQKEKATQALAEYKNPKSGDGFTTLTGQHFICLGNTYETRHYEITVDSEYANDLLQTKTMERAANQACNDRLIGRLQAKYDDSADETYQKRFPKDCYRVLRTDKGAQND